MRRVRWLVASIGPLLLLPGCGEGNGSGGTRARSSSPTWRWARSSGGASWRSGSRRGSGPPPGRNSCGSTPRSGRATWTRPARSAAATERELDLLRAGPRVEEIEQAKAEARRLELLWTVVGQGSRPEEVAAAREDVREVRPGWSEAEREVTRQEDLVARAAEPAGEPRPGDREPRLRARPKAPSEQRLLLLERGFRPEEVEAARQAWVGAVGAGEGPGGGRPPRGDRCEAGDPRGRAGAHPGGGDAAHRAPDPRARGLLRADARRPPGRPPPGPASRSPCCSSRGALGRRSTCRRPTSPGRPGAGGDGRPRRRPRAPGARDVGLAPGGVHAAERADARGAGDPGVRGEGGRSRATPRP